MSTRTIEFKAKQQIQKKEAVLAVAWITQQHGGFENPNVTASIQRALAAEGFKLSQERVKLAMIWLDEHDYAARSVLGRRHIMFVMDPDVEVPEPGFVAAKRLRDAAVIVGTPSQNGTTPMASPAASRPLPPLPNVNAPAWLPEATTKLTAWWRADPDTANAWAAELLRSLP